MDDPVLNQLLIENGWVTEGQVASLADSEDITVQSNRSRGQMPPHLKIGKRVLYNRDDIAEYIRTQRIMSKSPKSASADVMAGGA